MSLRRSTAAIRCRKAWRSCSSLSVAASVFFFAAALSVARRDRRSRDGLAPEPWFSNSWLVPSKSHPASRLLSRAAPRAPALSARWDDRHRAAEVRGLNRRDAFARSGRRCAVQHRTVRPPRPGCSHYAHRRELSSLVNLLNKLAWLMSVATHSANATANRNNYDNSTNPTDARSSRQAGRRRPLRRRRFVSSSGP